MKILIAGCLLLTSLSVFSQPKKLNPESAIQNVTVFSSGARIERTASVALMTGRSEISFAGLSNQLEQQTVQLKADADITLLSVQTTKDYLSVRKIDQEEKELSQSADGLKDRLDLDNRLLDVYKNEEAMLLKNQSIGGQSGVKATELKESLDLQRQRLTDVYAKELDIQKRILSGQQNFDRTQQQLQEIRKKKDSVSFIVTALVVCKESRTVHFSLLYNVKDAGWFSTYDVRVAEVTEPLSMMMNANIYQRSGETWKNVSLVLSTGSPAENATPSTLEPWMLGYYDPSVSLRGQGSRGALSGRVMDPSGQPISGANVLIKNAGNSYLTDANGFFKIPSISPGGMAVISSVGYGSREMALQPGYITVTLEPTPQTLNEVAVIGYGTADVSGSLAGVQVAKAKSLRQEFKTVEVVTQFQPTTMVYKIDDKYTLETDGKTTTIGIRNFEMPAVYDYYTAPKVDPSVFLTASIPNWQDYNLQSGEASLYYEGSYLGKTYIDLGSVTDTLSLSLGKDNGIKVTRKLIREYSSRKFIGSSQTENKDYEISVRNSKSVPVTVTILDQFPVSTNKDITVEDTKAPEGHVNKDSGIVTWTLAFPAGQERKLDIGYTVKYPKDRRLVLE